MAKGVLSTYQAAYYCNSSDSSIKRFIRSGKLKAYKTPGGHYRIVKNDLYEFMKKNNIPVLEKTELVRKKIIIVDDDEQVCESITKYLRSTDYNYDVLTAKNGFEAGSLVAQFIPDIIILDLVMPGMDGFDICRKIKRNPLTKNMKIVILTGYGSDENVKKAYDCGADMVLYKPANNEDILKAIEAVG